MYLLQKMVVFHRYVSLPEIIIPNNNDQVRNYSLVSNGPKITVKKGSQFVTS